MLYGGKDTKRMNKYKTPGYLKTDILENILKSHPEIGKPVISIKLNEEDIN